MKLKSVFLSAFLFMFGAGAASAHTAFLLPSDFTPDGNVVSVDAAYGATFFTPEIGVSADFHATGPRGGDGFFQSRRIGAHSSTLDLLTPDDGTYRVSTGEMLGPVTTMVAQDGAWRPLAQGETPPEGAETTTIQTVTVADTYLSKGAPNDAALAEPAGRLAIHPITNPTQASVQSGLTLELLFDGQPFPNMPFVLYEQGAPETDLTHSFVTGADGRAHLSFTHPGRYLAAVRYRTEAPEGADTDVQSYTTTITFEVTQ